VDLASISYPWRRGARYHYRRRLYLRKIVNRPITVPLATADPAEARRLATRLSAKWEVLTMQMFDRAGRGFLKAGELESVFRAGLDEELGLAMASRLDGGMTAVHDRRPLRVLEATYRPLADVLAEVEAMPAKTPRSDRTFNRDLTIMARFSPELAKTAWRPKFGKDLIVDFGAFTTSIKAIPGETDRMPWTEEQLVCAFSSPIYTGGSGCKRRLKNDPKATVWQDAAYWVPLLLAYTFMSREETCGLECVGVIVDVTTPFLLVKANMTKSKDGIHAAGLKRAHATASSRCNRKSCASASRTMWRRSRPKGIRCCFPNSIAGISQSAAASDSTRRPVGTCSIMSTGSRRSSAPRRASAPISTRCARPVGVRWRICAPSRSTSTISWAMRARARVRATTIRRGSPKAVPRSWKSGSC
jgi:hypothetical protein